MTPGPRRRRTNLRCEFDRLLQPRRGLEHQLARGPVLRCAQRRRALSAYLVQQDARPFADPSAVAEPRLGSFAISPRTRTVSGIDPEIG